MSPKQFLCSVTCIFMLLAPEIQAQDDALEMIEIAPGAAGGNPEYLTAADRFLYFTATDPASGDPELYRTDGTVGGTIRLTSDDISIPTDVFPLVRITLGNTLFFSAGQVGIGLELFTSDGTISGTALVKDINTTAPTAGSTIHQFATYDGLIYFQADEGTGNDLYVSDGTAAGTEKAADINGDVNSNAARITGLSFFVLFTAESESPASPDVGEELFQYTPAFGGTHALLKDINPGHASSRPRNLMRASSWVFFDASDGTHGRNLWKTDGTVTHTEMVKDFGSGGATFGESIALHDSLIFTVHDRDQIWHSDGTLIGTYMLAKPSGISFTNSDISELTLHDGYIYFRAFNGSTLDLWRTDGTIPGTIKVSGLTPAYLGINPEEITSCNNRLFFTGYYPTTGREVFEFNGVGSDPIMVENINHRNTTSNPSNLTCVRNTLFFTANDGNNGEELWAYTMEKPFPWPAFLPAIIQTR